MNRAIKPEDPGSLGAAPTIMIVEDDTSIREALAEVLEEEHYIVTQARHGQEALDLLRQGARPALLLLDLMMPVMTGWQLLEALRGDAALASVPVVVFSAAQGGAPVTGVRAVLGKPVALDTLLETVAMNLGPA